MNKNEKTNLIKIRTENIVRRTYIHEDTKDNVVLEEPIEFSESIFDAESVASHERECNSRILYGADSGLQKIQRRAAILYPNFYVSRNGLKALRKEIEEREDELEQQYEIPKVPEVREGAGDQPLQLSPEREVIPPDLHTVQAEEVEITGSDQPAPDKELG